MGVGVGDFKGEGWGAGFPALVFLSPSPHLAGELRPNGRRKLARLLQVGRGRLHPQQVGVRRVREAARDRGVDAVAHDEETFGRARARAELRVVG